MFAGGAPQVTLSPNHSRHAIAPRHPHRAVVFAQSRLDRSLEYDHRDLNLAALKFECDSLLPHSKRVFGGLPEPLVIWAQLHAAGSNLAVCLRAGPNRSEPSREGRASVCNRAVLTGWEILTLGIAKP